VNTHEFNVCFSAFYYLWFLFYALCFRLFLWLKGLLMSDVNLHQVHMVLWLVIKFVLTVPGTHLSFKDFNFAGTCLSANCFTNVLSLSLSLSIYIYIYIYVYVYVWIYTIFIDWGISNDTFIGYMHGYQTCNSTRRSRIIRVCIPTPSSWELTFGAGSLDSRWTRLNLRSSNWVGDSLGCHFAYKYVL